MVSIVERVLRDLGQPWLLEQLAKELSGSDLNSLLMEVFRQRAAELTPPKVLARYRADRFSRPAFADPRTLLELSRLCFDCMPPSMGPLELSPVAPLGAHSAIALVDQNNVLSATRSSEVLADPTNLLALHCAVARAERLAADPKDAEPVSFACSERVMRSQFGDEKGRTVHFRLFGMLSAGRDRGGFGFELQQLSLHLGALLRIVERLPELGLEGLGPVLRISDFSGLLEPRLQAELMQPLRDAFPGARVESFAERKRARAYYDTIAFELDLDDGAGSSFNVADGGCTDWTRKLLGNDKERCLITGLGLERLAILRDDRERPP